MTPSSSTSSLSSLDSEEKDTKPNVIVQLKLEGVGVAVISERPQELIYLSLSNIEVELNDSPSSVEIEAKMGDMQVDNMLFKAVFPNVIYRSSPKTEQEKVPEHTHTIQHTHIHTQPRIFFFTTLFFVVPSVARVSINSSSSFLDGYFEEKEL